MARSIQTPLPSPTRQAGDRVLLRLKDRGPQTAAELGRALGITAEAARQQLLRLAEEGWADFESEARGVGRPVQIWRLSPKGEARFPDSHGELATQLLLAAEKSLGGEGLGKLMEARGALLRNQYSAELAGVDGVGPKVMALAAIRRREGYMAESRKEGASHVLVEKHCPIRAAASVCPGLCGAELNLFRTVLGPGVTVNREAHILSGERCCAYRIQKAE